MLTFDSLSVNNRQVFCLVGVTMSKPIISGTSESKVLTVLGEHIAVLASGDETGSYEVFHQVGAEGSGPPPHSHPWDEAFYITKGEIAFGVGDQKAVGGTGTFVHVPARMTHWFRFGVGGGEMVSLTSRAGAASLFTEIAREISPSKPDFAKLVEIANRHGAKLAAPRG